MKRLKLSLCFFSYALLGFVNPCLAEDSFSEQQKKEIGEIAKDYIVKNPEVIKDAAIAMQKKEMAVMVENAKKIGFSVKDQLFSSKSPSDGAKSPKEVMVMFSDYQCGHCKKVTTTVDNMLTQNKDLKIIYKELPILGESSLLAAKAALAANRQGKYTEFHQKLMAFNEELNEANMMKLAKELGLDPQKLKTDLSSTEVQTEIQNNYQLAQKIGLRGTPAFFVTSYPNVTIETMSFAPGEPTQEKLQEMINKARKK